MKKLIIFLCAWVLMLAVAGNANSALVNRGGGLIYDDYSNITWLQDANYAVASGYFEAYYGSHLTWYEAMAWADQLEYGGYDDWRLPTSESDNFCNGVNCFEAEMGNLYYIELGNYYSPLVFNSGLFSNLDIGGYWLSTESWQNSEFSALKFAMSAISDGGGFTGDTMKGLPIGRAWAVRDGDVATVPISNTIWLLGSGLVVLAVLKKVIQRQPSIDRPLKLVGL